MRNTTTEINVKNLNAYKSGCLLIILTNIILLSSFGMLDFHMIPS